MKAFIEFERSPVKIIANKNNKDNMKIEILTIFLFLSKSIKRYPRRIKKKLLIKAPAINSSLKKLTTLCLESSP